MQWKKNFNLVAHHDGGSVGPILWSCKDTEQSCTCSWLHLYLSRYIHTLKAGRWPERHVQDAAQA